MDQDVDLLAKRVEKHRTKLDEQVTLLGMTEKRVSATDQDRQTAAREAERLEKRAKQAKRDARRLSSEAKRALVRLEASESDHDQAVKEAKALGKSVAKRQQKLAKVEGARAAVLAEADVDQTPPTRRRTSTSPASAATKSATPRKRAPSSTARKRTTKTSAARSSAAKKSR